MRRVLLLALLLAGAARAQEAQPLPEALQPYAERLARDKVVVTGERFRQVFSPYIGSELPVFVTSDSILAAYHVLFEESVVRLERARAARLAPALATLRAGLEPARKDFALPAGQLDAAERRARLVLDVALCLLGEAPPAADAALVTAEVARVEAAEGSAKPAWLGAPDPGFLALDYARFRPRGFYDRSEALQRYFRAVAWLQAIPFRVKHDEEYLGMLLLARALAWWAEDRAGFHRREACRAVLAGYPELLGPGDDPTLLQIDELCRPFDAEELAKERARHLKYRARAVNDQLALEPDGPSLRILPAARLPDAVLFQRTTSPERPLPQGLEVCAGLGSEWARARLDETTAARVDGLGGGGLYGGYLGCLRELLDAPEPDAPAFLRGDAWQAKSCQTALAGWAQLRHTWTLQARVTVCYSGLSSTEPGYVEPDPDFFGRLGRLAGWSREVLEAGGAFDPAMDRQELASGVQRFASWWRRHVEDRPVVRGSAGDAGGWLLAQQVLNALDLSAPDDPKELDTWLRGVERLTQELTDPKTPLAPEVQEVLSGLRPDLGRLWGRFERVCLRLEVLAHKQLRGVAFDNEERRFLEGYGELLGTLMFYDGNAYLNPRDDAPRVVEVFVNPVAGQRLHVGTGRARALYVLYPVGEGEVLCRGAVLPYFEFPHAEPLTDSEWKELLDGDARPAPPAWAASVLADAPPGPVGK